MRRRMAERMVFTVDEGRKQSWNHGWWRRRRKGKILAGMAAGYVVIGVALLVYGILHGGFGALWAPGASFEEAFPTFCCSVGGLTLLFCAGALAGNIWRVSRDPSTVKAEALAIEDGVLTYRFREEGLTPRGKVRMWRARLGECFWYWEPEKEQVVVWIGEGHVGAIMCGDVDVAEAGDADAALTRYADMLNFFPWFEPDLIGELRRLGVPEKELPSWRRFLNS